MALNCFGCRQRDPAAPLLLPVPAIDAKGPRTPVPPKHAGARFVASVGFGRRPYSDLSCGPTVRRCLGRTVKKRVKRAWLDHAAAVMHNLRIVDSRGSQ